jgi:hypothetical protein
MKDMIADNKKQPGLRSRGCSFPMDNLKQMGLFRIGMKIMMYDVIFW